MNLLNLVLLGLGSIFCLGVAGSYIYLHRGWASNTFSKMMVPNLLAEGVLFLWLSIARLFPSGEYRQVISSCLFALVVGVMGQRAYIYIKEEISLWKESNGRD